MPASPLSPLPPNLPSEYFGALNSGSEIFAVSNNAYMQIVRDCGLVNADVVGQRDADLQLLFEGANASAPKGEKDEFNSRRFLNRKEWIGVLAQLALGRYLGGVSDCASVSEAVDRLFLDDLAPRLPAFCSHDRNRFRHIYCYSEEVDTVLRRRETSLRHLYAAFAFGTGAIGDRVLSNKLLSYDEYAAFLDRLQLVDAHVTQRDARLAFLHSRMQTIDEGSVRGRSSVLQLRFEDFCECLVRLAYMKPLPTDDELANARVAHAAEYLLALGPGTALSEQFHQQRVRSPSEVAFGEPRPPPLEQPIADKLRHFIDWLLHGASGGASIDALSKADAQRFAKGLVSPPLRPADDEANQGAAPRGQVAGAAGVAEDGDVVEVRAEEADMQASAARSCRSVLTCEGTTPGAVQAATAE